MAEDFTLTVGIRYAYDEVLAEENVSAIPKVMLSIPIHASFRLHWKPTIRN